MVCHGLLSLIAFATTAPTIPQEVVITAREWASEPTGAGIYGNFVECGFGRQVEGMWAELFFNRCFEAVPPYSEALWFSQGNAGPTDNRPAAWWHSGYQENDWYLVPGNDQATWSTRRHISFDRGRQSGWLVNDSPDRPAAFAQDGIHLRTGESYVFQGTLRTADWEWDLGDDDRNLAVELRLHPAGDWTRPLAVHEIPNVGKTFGRFTWTYRNQDFQGPVTFSVWIPAQSRLNVDDFSAMPASTGSGWRADVLELARRLRPPVLRWPGGCFASYYDWRQGVGSRRDRAPATVPFWGGLFDHDVGTAEFVQFCRQIGAEPFFCANVMTGRPEDAAEWVAYCNAPADHPLGARRRTDGFAEPFGVQLWELGNETYRRFSAREYAERCVEFATAMRAVDPTLELVMVGYDFFRPELPAMLEIAGPHIDLVADRSIDEEELRRDLEVLREYGRRTGHALRLCNTEWQAPIGALPDAMLESLPPSDRTIASRRLRFESALGVASVLLRFQRLGGEFAFANYNNFVNTWGHNVIEAPRETAYLSAVGRVFEVMRHSPAARALMVEATDLPAGVEVQAAWDVARESLVLVVINRAEDAVAISFDGSALQRSFGQARVTTLAAPTLLSFEGPDRRDIEQQDTDLLVADPRRIDHEFSPCSLTHILLKPPASGGEH